MEETSKEINSTKDPKVKKNNSNLIIIIVSFLLGAILALALLILIYSLNLFGFKDWVTNSNQKVGDEESSDTDSDVDEETPDDEVETENNVAFEVELQSGVYKFTIDGNSPGEYETTKNPKTASIVDDKDIQTLLEGEDYSLRLSLPYEAEKTEYTESSEVETDFLEGVYRVKTNRDEYYKDYFYYTNDIIFKGSAAFQDGCSIVQNAQSCGSASYQMTALAGGNIPSLYVICKDSQQGSVCNDIVKSLKITGKVL